MLMSPMQPGRYSGCSARLPRHGPRNRSGCRRRLDRGNVQFIARNPSRSPRPQFERAAIRLRGSVTPSDRADRRTVQARKALREESARVMMKLMSPCRYSVTRLCGGARSGNKPQFLEQRTQRPLDRAPRYSMNSKPSVPIGWTYSWLPIRLRLCRGSTAPRCRDRRADDCNRGPLPTIGQ